MKKELEKFEYKRTNSVNSRIGEYDTYYKGHFITKVHSGYSCSTGDRYIQLDQTYSYVSYRINDKGLFRCNAYSSRLTDPGGEYYYKFSPDTGEWEDATEEDYYNKTKTV